MTDLVIKSSNSGGSVKLQTEGGTNGLTMASTGDLTTSGNVAVTGTMTGGTLGSGVTFPVGMVRRVFFSEKTDVQTISTTTGEGDVIAGTDQDGSGTQFGCTVSSPVIGYKYLIEVNLPVVAKSNISIQIFKEISSTKSNIGEPDTSGTHGATLNDYPANYNAHLSTNVRTIFTATATTDIFFGVYGRPDSVGNPNYINRHRSGTNYNSISAYKVTEIVA